MISSLFPKIAEFRDESVSRFWVIVTSERLAVGALSVVVCELVGLERRSDLDGIGPMQLFTTLVVVAPLLETLLFQSLPWAVADAFSWRTETRLALCWLPFAVAHLPSGFATFLCAGLGSGYYLAQTYIRLRGSSFSTAYGLTVASHAALNALVFLAMGLCDGR